MDVFVASHDLQTNHDSHGLCIIDDESRIIGESSNELT
jgi:hypothetical protein